MKALVFAAAVTLIPWADARPYETFYASLERQCPAKQLNWLGGQNLQEALLAHHVGDEAKRRMQHGWRTHCDADSFDSTCGNAVAMHVLIEEGQLNSFVGQLCRDYRRCTEVAICEPARKPD